METFIKKTFESNLLNGLSRINRLVMIQSMIAIVFSHRIDKKETIIGSKISDRKYHKPLDSFVVESMKDGLIDFSVMRDCMYHYSSGVESAFF
jgi:hypothetical protein